MACPRPTGRIEAQINEVRQAMQGDDVPRLRQRTEVLQQMVYALSQQAYAGRGRADGTPPRGDTVDGEFHEV